MPAIGGTVGQRGRVSGGQQLERLGRMHMVWVLMSVCANIRLEYPGSRIREVGARHWSRPNSGLDTGETKRSVGSLLEGRGGTGS